MDNLEPITRNEMFLNGDDLEPITREEMILAGADLEPITRHEWFLKKYRGGGGGGGYDLVNIPNLPADIASFNDGTDLPMASLKVAVTPYQDLHGYDNPWVGGAGKNKYEGSPLFDEYVDKNKWTLQAEKYNGHDVYKKSTAWGGMYKLTYLDVGTYTFSCMCKTSDSATIFIFLKIDNVTTAITDVTQISNATSTSWTKISGTFNVTSAGTVALRVERSNDNGDIYISEYQLESGSTPTSYAPYSNICPISGWDECKVEVVGKNLVESTLANTTINTNGEINVSGGSSTFDMHIAKIIKGKTYTIQSDESQNVNQKFVGGFFYDMPQLGSISYNNARLANTPATFTAPIDGYVVFRTSHEYSTPQCEVGNQSTEYTPYNPNSHTYTIDLDGTRYGGTLDVITGELTVTHVYMDLGTLNWRYYASGSFMSPYFYADITALNIKYEGNFTSTVYHLQCSQYESVARDPASTVDGKMCADGVVVQETVTQIQIKDSRFTDAASFKQAMNGVQLVYELATPITVQLAPTPVKSLEGTNNIFANCGQITEGKYFKKA